MVRIIGRCAAAIAVWTEDPEPTGQGGEVVEREGGFGGAGSDTVSNFENLTGSSFNDTLAGTAGANVIEGGAGNDVVTGGAGDD